MLGAKIGKVGIRSEEKNQIQKNKSTVITITDKTSANLRAADLN